MTEQKPENYDCTMVCTPIVAEEEKITSPLNGAKVPAYANEEEAKLEVENGDAINIPFDRDQIIEQSDQKDER